MYIHITHGCRIYVDIMTGEKIVVNLECVFSLSFIGHFVHPVWERGWGESLSCCVLHVIRESEEQSWWRKNTNWSWDGLPTRQGREKWEWDVSSMRTQSRSVQVLCKKHVNGTVFFTEDCENDKMHHDHEHEYGGSGGIDCMFNIIGVDTYPSD